MINNTAPDNNNKSCAIYFLGQSRALVSHNQLPLKPGKSQKKRRNKSLTVAIFSLRSIIFRTSTAGSVDVKSPLPSSEGKEQGSSTSEVVCGVKLVLCDCSCCCTFCKFSVSLEINCLHRRRNMNYYMITHVSHPVESHQKKNSVTSARVNGKFILGQNYAHCALIRLKSRAISSDLPVSNVIWLCR